jgi:hypothetical protein
MTLRLLSLQFFPLLAKYLPRLPAHTAGLNAEQESTSTDMMNPFCQIEFVFSDGDVGTPCGQPALFVHANPAQDFGAYR